MKGRTVQRVLLAVSVGLWGVSLALPAIQVTGGPTLSGWDVLLQGFSAWRQGVFAWWANPLLWLAAALCWWRRDRLATAFALVAFGFGLTSLWAVQTGRGNGAPVPDIAYLCGFYAWSAAQIGVVCAALGGLALRRDAAPN